MYCMPFWVSGHLGSRLVIVVVAVKLLAYICKSIDDIEPYCRGLERRIRGIFILMYGGTILSVTLRSTV